MPTRSILKSKDFIPVDDLNEEHATKYPIVFTAVICGWNPEEGAFLTKFASCTVVIGQTAHINPNDGTIRAIEGGLYILNVAPAHIHARFYDGIVGFHQNEGAHFAVVYPDMHPLTKMEPVTRWRFQYLSFEYPRKRKRGFLLPILNAKPFAYGFISQAERERIEHLCPPEPIARYAPEEFGYHQEELSRYLEDEENKLEHIDELLPILEDIFDRIGGDPHQHIIMLKRLVPAEYRDYDLLYGAEVLGGWDDEATG